MERDTWLSSGFSCSVPRGMLDCEIFAYQLCWPFCQQLILCVHSPCNSLPPSQQVAASWES